MLMKKLTPERRQVVETELALWQTFNRQAQKVVLHSDEWFELVKQRNACFNLIQTTLSLSMKRVDQLCWGHANLETYYEANGEPRRDVADRS